MRGRHLIVVTGASLTIYGLAAPPASSQTLCPNGTLTGQAVLASGWKQDAPGTCRKLLAADLPPPSKGGTQYVNGIPRPAALPLRAPLGFSVALAYRDANAPRLLHASPNGDIFVSESRAGVVRVLRPDGRGGFSASGIFASGLNYPFGVGFYPSGPNPEYVYVAETNRVVRFPYRRGDLAPRGARQVVVPSLPSNGGHVSRDIAFMKTRDFMLISVGSGSNDGEPGVSERDRADILYATPDGRNLQVFAWGLRNPVGLAIEPSSGQVWTSVNERDSTGDNLVPDYVTRVQMGKFYGWPWYYIGRHVDPRHVHDAAQVSNIIVPDLLLVAHSAPIGLGFYTGTRFPELYRHGAFVATHGSWDRTYRNGSKVVFVPAKTDGSPGDTYQDFLTGFTIAHAGTSDGTGTWGRPAGIATGADGSLYVSDDYSRTIWRVTYGG